MSRSLFDPPVGQFPVALPLFPLSGTVLLPGGKLPLNIFEPRYLAMIGDALKSERMIGMVQPREGQEKAQNPSVYRTGCVGRITSFAETDDGRYLVTLSGLCRFDIAEELEPQHGYRRVRVDFAPYRADLEEAPDGAIDRRRLLDSLRAYFKAQAIKADWKAIEESSDERLVSTLAMVCPFQPNEKQALLESPDLIARGRTMIAILDMASLGHGGELRH
jgi:uncharacterized protein